MERDLQVGVVGEYEPQYCGCGCGEEVKGRHSVSHSLGNGRYALYLAKHDHLWNEAHPESVEKPPTFRKIILPEAIGNESAPAVGRLRRPNLENVISAPTPMITSDTKGKE